MQWVWLPLAHVQIRLRGSDSRGLENRRARNRKKWRDVFSSQCCQQWVSGISGLSVPWGARSSVYWAAVAAGWSDVFTLDFTRKGPSSLITGVHILQVIEAHPTAHTRPVPLEPDSPDMCHSSLGFSIKTTPISMVSSAYLCYCCREFGARGKIWDRNMGLSCHLLRFPSWSLSSVYL